MYPPGYMHSNIGTPGGIPVGVSAPVRPSAAGRCLRGWRCRSSRAVRRFRGPRPAAGRIPWPTAGPPKPGRRIRQRGHAAVHRPPDDRLAGTGCDLGPPGAGTPPSRPVAPIRHSPDRSRVEVALAGPRNHRGSDPRAVRGALGGVAPGMGRAEDRSSQSVDRQARFPCLLLPGFGHGACRSRIMPIDVKPGIPVPSTYVFIRCDDRLQFCDGIPGSEGIPGSTDTEAGSGRGATATFTIHRAGWGGHGLHGHIIDDPGPASTSPPNPVASCLVSAPRGPDQFHTRQPGYRRRPERSLAPRAPPPAVVPRHKNTSSTTSTRPSS